MKKCKYCGNELIKLQKKYCSRECSNKDNAKKLSKDRIGNGNPMFGKKAWNNGIPQTDMQKKRQSEIIKKLYKEKGNVIGFKNGNKTKSQFKNGHIVWSANKKMSPEFCLKVKLSKLKNPWYPNETQKKIISEKNSGSNHANWKGGITKESAKRFNNRKWKKIVKKIREKYNNKCQKCGKENSKDVHHVIPFRISRDNSEKNLILYCKSCHLKVERAIK
jgi:hypothetical protein